MSEENMGEQFKGIAGAQLLNDAFDGLVSIAGHFTEPEHAHVIKGITAAAASMALAIHKHSGVSFEGDDKVSKMSVQDHLDLSHRALVHSLPSEILHWEIPDHKNPYDGLVHDYDTKNPHSLNKEGKEIQRKYGGFLSNIREYTKLMGNK
jgi:hypothetical protein